jgi:hypothetical protein
MRTFVGLEAGHLSEASARAPLRRLIECAPDLTVGPQAMVAGAHAFLEKHGRDVDDLLDMIRAADRHGRWPLGG